jgi:hypothetical protein
VLHLVGHFMCIFIESDARNHERKINDGLFFRYYSTLDCLRETISISEQRPREDNSGCQ